MFEVLFTGCRAEYERGAEVENNGNIVASKPKLEYVSELASFGCVYV